MKQTITKRKKRAKTMTQTIRSVKKTMEQTLKEVDQKTIKTMKHQRN